MGGFLIFLREVCTVIYCDDTECKYYSTAGCTAVDIHHSTDRFCVTGRRTKQPEYKQMMRYNSPIDYKRCEKDVSN